MTEGLTAELEARLAAAEAMLRARTDIEARLRESEYRQAFFLELSDALRPLDDGAEIERVAVHLIGERLGADRVFYASVEPDGEHWSFRQAYRSGMPSEPGRFAFSGYQRKRLAQWQAGEMSSVADSKDDPRLDADDRASYAAVGARAAIGVPLVKHGRFAALLVVSQATPRRWTPAELAMTREAAERTWQAMERARAQAALRESEARFRALTEAIDDVFYVTDLDAGRLDYLSPSYARIWGRPVASLVADPASFVDAIHPDDHGEVARAQAAQARGEPVRSEYRMVRPDGEVRWILNRCFPVPTTGRRRSAGVASDITERKHAEAARRESEEQQRLLGELVPALLWAADPRGERITLNRSWCAYTGQSAEETCDVGWLAAIHPDDLPATRAAFEHAFATGEPLERQQRIRKAGGNYRWHLVRHVPARGEDGVITRWFGAAIDIHDLHEMQQHQRLLVAELQHRVRNILTVTRLTFARTFEQGDDMDEMASHFRGRLDAMARTQVMLSRTAHRSADLEDLIRDELLSVGATDAAGVTLEGPEVALDHKVAEALGMALHELTTNALKYGALKVPGGGLEVRWKTHMGEGGRQVLDLIWEERGVPAVSVRPVREGFGRELIEEALPYRIRATTALEFRGGGVRCSISVPLPDGSGGSAEAGGEQRCWRASASSSSRTST